MPNPDSYKFKKKFASYVRRETGCVSLKNFVEFDLASIIQFSQGITDVKRFWNNNFDNYIKENNIANVKDEQPDWTEIASKIQQMSKTDEKNENKRRTSSSSTSLPTSSTLSSSTAHTSKRRKKYVDFLLENEAPEVILTNDAKKWKIGDIGITQQLLEYRSESIEKVKSGKSITIHEELSLNGIFVIDHIGSLTDGALEYGFDKGTWRGMVDECNHRYPIQELSTELVASVNKFAKTARQDFWKVNDTIEKIAVSEENALVVESLRRIASAYAPNTSYKCSKSGSAFTTEVINPCIMPFLQENGMITLKQDEDQLPRSVERNKNIEHRFDLSIFFEYGNLPQQQLVLIEIKSPMSMSNGERQGYVKLGNAMKTAIDNMIMDGLDDESIPVVGLLIEGFRCTFFVMDLVYQATYRMIPLMICYLPRSRYDFSVLPYMYEVTLGVRGIMLSSAHKCFAFHRRKGRQTIRSSYIIESLKIPTLDSLSEIGSLSAKSASSLD